MSTSEQEELRRQQEEVRIREEADQQYGSGFQGYEYYEAGGTDEVEAVIKRLKTRDQETGDQILDDKAFDKLRSFRDEGRIPVFADQISPLKRKSMWLFSRKSFSKKLKNFGIQRKNWEQTDDGIEWTKEIQRLDGVLDRKEEVLEEEKEYRSRIAPLIVHRGQICQAARAASDRKLAELTAGKPELQSRFTYQGAADPDEMDRVFRLVNPESIDGKISADGAEFLNAELAMSEQDMKVLAVKERGFFSDYKDMVISYSRQAYGYFNRALRAGNDKNDAMLLRTGLSGLRINRDLVTRRGVYGVDCLAHMIGIDSETDPDTGLPLTEDRLMELFQKKMAQHPEGLIVSDKGFFSTALKDTGGFPAEAHGVRPGEPAPKMVSTRGIEFIVLVRKGTCAADIKTETAIKSEWEILVNAGTRFRVVKAFFNTGAPGDQRKIHCGDGRSWKIYLETIPPEDDGTERDED